MAVNHDGDSDLTGAIAGNLLGAMHGVEAIPARWLEPLELRNVISEVAEDLYAFKDWPIGQFCPDSEASRSIRDGSAGKRPTPRDIGITPILEKSGRRQYPKHVSDSSYE